MPPATSLTGFSGFTYGATAPQNPSQNHVWVYPADDTNGVNWCFIFDPAETTYKWRMIGGPPLLSESSGISDNCTTGTMGTSTWSDFPSNVGPSITAPFAGDYQVAIGCRVNFSASRTYNFWCGVKNGASNPASTNDWLNFVQDLSGISSGSSTFYPWMYKKKKVNISAASTLLKMIGQVNAGTTTAEDRQIEILPIRVIA